MDHVHPKSRGGDKSWTNIVTCCKVCNLKKRNQTPKEARMPLLRKPHAPRVKMIDLYRNIYIREEWKDFIRR
jgi:5-methylcytosine-specific restriction endonuclease McrA